MGEGGALSAGVRTTRALRSLVLVEQRQSEGWMCWARGGMGGNGAGKEGEAWPRGSFIPPRRAGAGGVILICPVRRTRLQGSLLPSAAWPEAAGAPGASGPLQILCRFMPRPTGCGLYLVYTEVV